MEKKKNLKKLVKTISGLVLVIIGFALVWGENKDSLPLKKRYIEVKRE